MNARPSVAKTDRRTFLRRTTAGVGTLWIGALQDFAVSRARGEAPSGGSPYGPLFPTRDEATGFPLLQLPEGFRYISYGWTGDVMSDGVRTPAAHDGMAVVAEITHNGDDDDDRLFLVRNHEMAQGAPFVNDARIVYLSDGAGGTTNLIFNANQGRWERAWSSLAGTIRNCAGGVTPWGTWITCEETTIVNHGWCFEVAPDVGSPRPLTDMGRFSHEAVMVDARTGYVYETEDAANCGFYQFVPARYGRLEQGGELYMLKVAGAFQADLGRAFRLGTTWPVEWVRIDDPRAVTTSVFLQGRAKGGARFSRLEGCWWEDSVGYFLSTDGGQVAEGQVFEYDPRRQTIKLIYDSPSAAETENPDNIVVTPRGGLLLCEDNAGPTTNDAERLIGLTLDGKAFTFAKNDMNLLVLGVPPGKVVARADYRQREWAGTCYSPDGRWLFVNIYAPGVTFAVTGPWHRGPL